MDEKTHLYPFFATLATICYISTLAAALAMFGKYIEAIGFGGLTVGLIGVIKLPTSRSVTVDNPPSQPVPVDAA